MIYRIHSGQRIINAILIKGDIINRLPGRKAGIIISISPAITAISSEMQ